MPSCKSAGFQGTPRSRRMRDLASFRASGGRAFLLRSDALSGAHIFAEKEDVFQALGALRSPIQQPPFALERPERGDVLRHFDDAPIGAGVVADGEIADMDERTVLR